jgi:hypothetical protein
MGSRSYEVDLLDSDFRLRSSSLQVTTAMASDRIRILCVDDHPLVRNGIAYAIIKQRDMKLVEESCERSGGVGRFPLA